MTKVEELQRTGIHRTGRPKSGFRWVGATRQDLDRLHELKIPPAWTDVAVSRSPQSKVQAVGKDKAGRWQYRYNDRAVVEREQKKYQRLVAFGRALPKLRKEIDRGLRLPGLPRDRVMACILRILSTCFMRPGSEVYAKENGSFGIATLRKRHVRVNGDVVRFDYEGKSKKRQIRELRDRRVARALREMMQLPGHELFKYRDEDGDAVNITRRMINDKVKDVMGENFSAKDFRTWAGTMICANVLARLHGEAVDGVTDRRKMLTAAVKETAAQLGNTPAVCKSSYIWPSILSSAYEGTVLSSFFPTVEAAITSVGRNRSACEAALLELLGKGRGATPIAIAKKMARRRREKQATPKLSRRMRSPRMRRLAQAFTN
ncbi:MAG TPA: DNA topoisomerase IB [Myxococcales bacterium]|nr:DNA topoisomerase IB [Myxococcales bacterium]